MEIFYPRLKELENLLRKLKIQARSEKVLNNELALLRNAKDSLYAAQQVIRIFILTESKEAERILRDLLDHWHSSVKFLVFCTLWDAESSGADLDWRTQIKLEQFKNNPVNSNICIRAESQLKKEKAPFN